MSAEDWIDRATEQICFAACNEVVFTDRDRRNIISLIIRKEAPATAAGKGAELEARVKSRSILIEQLNDEANALIARATAAEARCSELEKALKEIGELGETRSKWSAEDRYDESCEIAGKALSKTAGKGGAS